MPEDMEVTLGHSAPQGLLLEDLAKTVYLVPQSSLDLFLVSLVPIGRGLLEQRSCQDPLILPNPLGRIIAFPRRVGVERNFEGEASTLLPERGIFSKSWEAWREAGAEIGPLTCSASVTTYHFIISLL